MVIKRMDHVSVVVDDMNAAHAFFLALGMTVEGQAPIEGDAVDRLNALDGIRVDIAMLRTPDGFGRLELTKFHAPPAVDRGPEAPNTLGLRSVMFEVDDLDATIESLRPHGAVLVGTIEEFDNGYRLAYVRGPANIIVALAQQNG